MRYSGLQPQYFPRLHYFARILCADMFVFRDDVQFVRKHKYPDGHVGKSYQAHTPIKDVNGTAFLTVPVKHDGRQTLINTEVMYESSWVEDHLKTLLYAYHKAPYFNNIQPELTALLHTKYRTIAELNTATTLWGILRLIGETSVTPDKLTIPYVETRLVEEGKFRLRKLYKESETAVAKHPEIKKNERIIALCKELGATEDYCGGTATAAYVDHSQFEKEGIIITVQDWKCHEYEQQFSKNGFTGNLSLIDLLMNVSQKEAVEIIDGKRPATRSAHSVLYGSPLLEPEVLVFLSEITAVLPRGLLAL